MKTLMCRVLPLFLIASFAAGQSLVDLSKAEKARRDRMRGKTVRLVTNKDLAGLRTRLGAAETPAPRVYDVRLQPWPPALGGPEPRGEGDRRDARDEGAYRERGARISDLRYATSVLSDTEFVDNAEEALGPRDGLFASIEYGGYLDLACEAWNGPGLDLAVFAQRPPVGFVPQFYSYVVMGSDDGLDWTEIGQGNGMTSPELFDLGDLASVRMIRIAYRLPTTMNQQLKPYRLNRQDYAMGIDAVESLNG